MAITLRCTECSKKISVDEAFAGSMCRCPYCKAILSVPESGREGTPPRPAAPSRRPDRPGAPRAETPVPPTGQPSQAQTEQGHSPVQHVVTAKPVRVQGALTLILLGLLALVIVGLTWVLVIYTTSPEDGPPHTGPVPEAPRDPNAPPPPSEVNPFAAGGSSVVAGDIRVAPPVAYVVDAGGSMRPTIGYAGIIVYRSVASLPDSAKAVLLVMEDASSQGLTRPLAGPVTGGTSAAERIVKVLDTTYPQGPTDAVIPAAMETAEKAGAKTVVLLTRGPMDDEKAVAAMKSWVSVEGRKLVLISIGSRPMDARDLEQVAREAGATFRSYDEYQLRTFLDEAPLE